MPSVPLSNPSVIGMKHGPGVPVGVGRVAVYVIVSVRVGVRVPVLVAVGGVPVGVNVIVGVSLGVSVGDNVHVGMCVGVSGGVGVEVLVVSARTKERRGNAATARVLAHAPTEATSMALSTAIIKRTRLGFISRPHAATRSKSPLSGGYTIERTA